MASEHVSLSEADQSTLVNRLECLFHLLYLAEHGPDEQIRERVGAMREQLDEMARVLMHGRRPKENGSGRAGGPSSQAAA